MTQVRNGVGLVRATRQDWVAGIKGGGSGTEYSFTVTIAGSDPVIFGAVSIGGVDHVAMVHKRGGPVTQQEVVPHAGDTLDLRVSVRRPEVASSMDTASTPATGTSIHFTIKGEPVSLPVEHIEQLAPQNRP